MQREAARGRETIEGAAARVPGRRDVILALVQKNAGLLAAQQVRVQLQPVHLDGNHLRNLARQHTGFQRKVFAFPNRGVVALHNSARREKLFETAHDLELGAIHALIQRLHREVVAVAIDHQARQLIAFPMHQPIGVRDSATTRLRYASACAMRRRKNARSIVSTRSESIRNEICDALL